MAGHSQTLNSDDEIKPKSIQLHRSSDEEEEDRISILPDETLLQILTFVPINNAICTSLVSKRWTSLWKSLPSLVFRRDGILSEKFIAHVQKVLLFYANDNIQSFCLAFNLQRNDELYDEVEGDLMLVRDDDDDAYYPLILHECDIDSWVHTAIKLKVKKLELLFNENYSSNASYVDYYDLPRALYRHQMLTSLRLRFCGFRNCPNEIEWKSLKSLSIDKANISDELLGKLLGTCAKLECLALSDCFGMKRIDVVSSNLKELSLGHCGIYYGRVSGDTVQISAPNLELLVISGPLYYEEFVVDDQSSLVEATARILSESSSSDFGHVTVNVTKILLNVQHAKKLTLGTWCLKDLFAESLPLPVLSCKSLILDVDLDDMYLTELPNIFETCPKMETLIVYLTNKTWTSYSDAPNYERNCFWMQADTEYESLSQHLKMVKINGVIPGSEGAEHVIGLVQFILKQGRVLEKVSIHTQWKPESSPNVDDSLFELSQKLLSCPRSSTSAVVELTRDRIRILKLDDDSWEEDYSDYYDSDD